MTTTPQTTTDPLGDWFRHIGTKLSDTDYEAGIKALSWARDQFHPTRTNPTDAEVQAAAKAMDGYDCAAAGIICDWDDLPEENRQLCLGSARAALVAARKVAAPPPSEPIVEAAAQAMSDSDRPAHGLTPEWDQREPEERNRYRALAHVAIRTAWQAARHE